MQRGQRDGLTAGKAAAAAALAGASVTGAGGIAVDAVDAESGFGESFSSEISSALPVRLIHGYP